MSERDFSTTSGRRADLEADVADENDAKIWPRPMTPKSRTTTTTTTTRPRCVRPCSESRDVALRASRRRRGRPASPIDPRQKPPPRDLRDPDPALPGSAAALDQPPHGLEVIYDGPPSSSDPRRGTNNRNARRRAESNSRALPPALRPAASRSCCSSSPVAFVPPADAPRPCRRRAEAVRRRSRASSRIWQTINDNFSTPR